MLRHQYCARLAKLERLILHCQARLAELDEAPERTSQWKRSATIVGRALKRHRSDRALLTAKFDGLPRL